MGKLRKERKNGSFRQKETLLASIPEGLKTNYGKNNYSF